MRTKVGRTLVMMISIARFAGCESRDEPALGKSGETTQGEIASRPSAGVESTIDSSGKYAAVNGLNLYYEIHGTGRPLVLLHGAFGTATVFPALTKDRRIITIELQGHGHTADIDRPLTFEQMADGTGALLRHLKIEQADVFGYSMGGNVAIAVAIRHPMLVRKLVINGSNYGRIEDAYSPEAFAQFKGLSSDFAPPVLKDPYDKVAPDPKQWPGLVAKIKAMGLEFKGFSREDMQSIRAHVLVTIGDRDVVSPEHAVEMFRLIPDAQLAVFPGADHFSIWQSPDKIFPAIAAFLDAPTPTSR